MLLSPWQAPQGQRLSNVGQQLPWMVANRTLHALRHVPLVELHVASVGTLHELQHARPFSPVCLRDVIIVSYMCLEQLLSASLPGLCTIW